MTHDRPTLILTYPTRRKEGVRMATETEPTTDIKFRIKVFPSLSDPHNWKWSVRWYRKGQAYTRVGPMPTENVLSTPLAARQTAEQYARAMARGLAESLDYTLDVPVSHA